ncbi:MAG: pantoate--beta-alanine ligase [Acidimicrobiia bacterium]
MPTVVIEHAADLRAHLNQARGDGASVGFVPTMGAFHTGHRSLMQAARAGHGVVVVSLFVNPLQFGPAEDLDRYPRDLTGDLTVATGEGVDILFAPGVAEVYPVYPPATTVRVAGLTEGLCGACRPGHFDGVTTVVAKLFAMVGPCAAYFGRKDAQQLAVVRRMAADLCLPVEVVGCPLVREADGLALSSRNRRLVPEERRAASVLHRGLQAGADLVAGGERDARRLRRVVANVVTTEPLVRLEYVEVVGAHDLVATDTIDGDVLVALAATVGDVRLIDNMTIHVSENVGAGASADLGVTSDGRAWTPREGSKEAMCAAG